MFSRKTVAMRAVVEQLVDMSKQDMSNPSTLMVVKAVKAETIASGWKAALTTMAEALETRGLVACVLSAGDRTLLVQPRVMLRYSAGRLSPGDAFGRCVWDILRAMASGAPKSSDSDWNRRFARARAALEAFSLDVASRVGKTAKEHAAVTLRSLDHISPEEVWMHPETAAWVQLVDRAPCELRRHPLPTFGQQIARVASWVPVGTLVVNPLVLQWAASADCDGDQGVVDVGHPSATNHVAGAATYMHAGPDLAGTPMVAFLQTKPLAEKLGYKGLLRIPVEQFVTTLYQQAEYGVCGIGQVGYNPALAMATLGLVGEADFKPLMGTGYRRLYEDLMLAGLTPERWALFTAARKPGDDLLGLQAKFNAVGVTFTEKETACYVVARSLAQAIGQMERNGFVSEKVMEALGENQRHINLFGLVKALDAGRLDSVFLPLWQETLAKYQADNEFIRTLAAVAPVAAKAGTQRRQVKQAAAERAEYS
jgi:hypothetical protein